MAEVQMVPGAGYVKTETDGGQKMVALGRPGLVYFDEEAAAAGTTNPRLFNSTVFKGKRLVRSA